MSTVIDNNPGMMLFGKSRRAILALLYGHADEEFYLREIVRTTGLGVGSVQRELKLLTDSGLASRRLRGNQVYYQANPETPIFEELKSIVRKTFGVADIVHSALTPVEKQIEVAFIFGSVARSTDDRRSDLDLMVIGDISFGDVVSLLKSAEEKIGREINPVVYGIAEFRKKVHENRHFISTVLEEEKIFVTGNNNDLGKLAER